MPLVCCPVRQQAISDANAKLACCATGPLVMQRMVVIYNWMARWVTGVRKQPDELGIGTEHIISSKEEKVPYA